MTTTKKTRTRNRPPARRGRASRPRPADDGELAFVTGQTRSGKTWLVADELRDADRLLVWDPKGRTGWAANHRCRLLTAPGDLHAFCIAGEPGRVAYSPIITPGMFDHFCRLAWVWVRMEAVRGQRVALVVDELADVTSPGKAPPAWGEIVRKGMEFAPRVYGITQRPTEADSTLRGNALLIRTHAMGWADDRKLMARALDVPQSRVDELRHDRKEFIQRDMRTRELVVGGKDQAPRALESAQS